MSTPTETAGTFNASAAPLTALPTSQTSSLERYLAQIPDPALRESISREIAGMGQNFGLVFERHHPEGIKLPKHKVKRGSKVVINTVKDSGYFRVARLFKAEGTALLVDDDGNEDTYPVEALTVAKEFGDVMYPGLKKLSEVRRGAPDAPVHTIINGENYHALEALQYTHAGKVDLIYIDPPYNTGNADWKYNDRYIDSKDGYRHSKWLSFMEKRLLIARQLLKPTGVVIMAIDDNEHHRLRMLADDVFGENNFIANLTWQGSGSSLSKATSGGVDYMLAYARNREDHFQDQRWLDAKVGVEEVIGTGSSYFAEAARTMSAVDSSRAATERMKKWWTVNAKRFDPGMKLYNRVSDDGRVYQTGDLSANNNSFFEVLHPNGLPVKKPSTGWRCSETTMQQWLSDGKIEFGKDESTTPRFRRYLDELTTQLPSPTIVKNRVGSKHLERIFADRRFPFPKDHDELMRWFRMVAPKDAVVLDFFGGSGTTAEAVIRLNAEDGGTRQTILVTNNELAKKDDAALRKAGHLPGDDAYEALGVFRHVTKPRLETVVTGVREDGSKYSDGLDANVAFFELTYLDEPEIVTGRALNDLAGLFWLKAGGIGGTVELDAGTKAEGFAISESGSTAILFTPGRAKALAEKLASNGQPITHLFIVTDSEAQGDEAASHFAGGINVERIYGSYLEAFQVNRKD